MQFPEAYSHQLQRLINVDEAVRAFDQKTLTNPKDFECPDVHCAAPLRLNALAGVLSGNSPGKRDPYFSTDGDRNQHGSQCEFFLSETIGRGFVRKRPNWKDDLKNINLDDVFDFARPNIVRPQVAGKSGGGAHTPAQGSIIAAQKAQRQNLSHYSLLESVVDRFNGMPAGLATKKCIRIGANSIPYCDAFVPITDIDQRGVNPNDVRIYMGQAILKKSNSKFGGYDFFWSTNIDINGINYRGKLWISDKDLLPIPSSTLAPGVTRMNRRIANALLGRNSKIVELYLLGNFFIQNQPQGQQPWLGFKVSNLDHVFFEII